MRNVLSRKSIAAASLCATAATLGVLLIVASGANAEMATSSTTTPDAINNSASVAEPTTTAPTTPNRGDEAPMRNPFAPFDNGPIEGR